MNIKLTMNAAMPMNAPKRYARVLVSILALAGMAGLSQAAVTQQLEPTTIGLGDAAQLTIAASGGEATRIEPPMVAGLEFVALGQSQRLESINGVTHSSTSVTYQVIPRQAGVFTIPNEAPGAQPVVLTVKNSVGSAVNGTASVNGSSSANGSGSVNASGASAGAGLPQAAAGALPRGATHVAADGSAFVRLRLSKHQLYVGETIPVEIQVGTRDGVVASLNGLPTLNGDAFTLDKLSPQPERSQEIVDGKPFTVFTWHSALAAVKPGDLSLTMETPLTVRVRTTRTDGGPFGDSGLDDFFNDPNLQSFFGGSTEREVTVASAPTAFTVLALPAQDRPADFSGAVGQFTVSSDLSDDKAAAGDPVTLRLHVSGSGNFERVNSRMLHDVDHWKTYAPTATFKPADAIGYRGEKTFDQPVIALQPGAQSLPPLSFSWFDPVAHRYAESRTAPLRVAITPAANPSSSVAGATPEPQSRAAAGTVAANQPAGSDMRPDHVVTGGGATSLMPHYYQAAYWTPPSLLLCALCGAGFWLRRRDRTAEKSAAARRRAASLDTAPLLQAMDQAAGASDAASFLKSARQAVQRALASRWQVAPETVTPESTPALREQGADVARLFELADEANYSTVKLTTLDFKHWKQLVLGYIGETVS